MLKFEMKPKQPTGGDRVRQVCLAVLGLEPLITIDVPTRVAFTIPAISADDGNRLADALSAQLQDWETQPEKF